MNIQKAGGIVVRRNTQNEIEILCIHRVRYNDWSLPKGHIEESETPENAVVREVLEETGFLCEIQATLPDQIYTLPNGDVSIVHMFVLRKIEERLEHKDTEADQCEWMTIDQALKRISYINVQDYIIDNTSRIEASV